MYLRIRYSSKHTMCLSSRATISSSVLYEGAGFANLAYDHFSNSLATFPLGKVTRPVNSLPSAVTTYVHRVATHCGGLPGFGYWLRCQH